MYYLARADNHTLFDLGKSPSIVNALIGRPIPFEAVYLSKLLAHTVDGRDHHYRAELARRIAAFCDGQRPTLVRDDDLTPAFCEGNLPRVVDSRFAYDWRRMAALGNPPLWTLWAADLR